MGQRTEDPGVMKYEGCQIEVHGTQRGQGYDHWYASVFRKLGSNKLQCTWEGGDAYCYW